ncbi:MAG: RagB/SusD family nutrient uptake outer membrane protein, partial [Alistipes sp.]|nr:RagB/SusD family nutrient uptake outer membrane protein [Alistipes sp.]
NESVTLLEGFTRTNKATIDQQVAYGLRSRVNLVLQNYEEAASDAAEAMAGYTPYTIAELGKPTFWDGTHHAWIWGSIVNLSDLVPEYEVATWQSWLGSLSGNGYASGVACYARCNTELYNKIPASDVRKGWWVDENLESPLIEGLEWPGAPGVSVAEAKIPEVKEPFYPYTNVKFGPTDDKVGNTDCSGDWPLMRVEEMLLIQAEATGLGGNVSAGAKLLEDFVKAYRNPEYKCTATDEDAFRNEIWLQRRIELWGEGFFFTDMMRFNKPLVRFHGSRKDQTNWPDAYRFNIPAGDEAFLVVIPRSEINSNEGISEEENNTGGTTPVPDQNPNLLDGVTD